MIILRTNLYSRHTPKHLKKYKEYKDEDYTRNGRNIFQLVQE